MSEHERDGHSVQMKLGLMSLRPRLALAKKHVAALEAQIKTFELQLHERGELKAINKEIAHISAE